MKPYKSRKFEKRNSDGPEKREFSRTSRPEKREFSNYSKPEKNFDRRDSGSSGRKDSGFELYHAICDKCGVECDVPFKPTGNKPIYCRACFRAGASESSGRSSSFDRRSESKGRYYNRTESKTTSNLSKEDLDKINRKLDKIMKVLKIE